MSKAGKLKGKLGAFAKEREEFEQKRKELQHEMAVEKHNMGMIRKGKTHEMKLDGDENDFEEHEHVSRKASVKITGKITAKGSHEVADNTKNVIMPSGSRLSDWCYTSDLDSMPPTIKSQTLYEEIRFIGRGAFGNVDLYKNIDDSKLYACKSILIEQKYYETAVLKEIKILRDVRNPFIVDVRDVWMTTNPRKLFLIMHYCESGDLGKTVQACAKSRTWVPEGSIVKWVAQIGLALLHLYDRGIVHRDIKPGNILLCDNGEIAQLADFGLADYVQEESECVVATQGEVGTPYYTAPEMINNQPVSYKSDMWSLGVVLFELLTLQLPFEGDSVMELVRSILCDDYRRDLIPSSDVYSPELTYIIDEMLAKDQAERISVPTLLASRNVIAHRAQQMPSTYRPKYIEERLRRHHVKSIVHQFEDIGISINTSTPAITSYVSSPDIVSALHVVNDHNNSGHAVRKRVTPNMSPLTVDGATSSNFATSTDVQALDPNAIHAHNGKPRLLVKVGGDTDVNGYAVKHSSEQSALDGSPVHRNKQYLPVENRTPTEMRDQVGGASNGRNFLAGLQQPSPSHLLQPVDRDGCSLLSAGSSSATPLDTPAGGSLLSPVSPQLPTGIKSSSNLSDAPRRTYKLHSVKTDIDVLQSELLHQTNQGSRRPSGLSDLKPVLQPVGFSNSASAAGFSSGSVPGGGTGAGRSGAQLKVFDSGSSEEPDVELHTKMLQQSMGQISCDPNYSTMDTVLTLTSDADINYLMGNAPASTSCMPLTVAHVDPAPPATAPPATLPAIDLSTAASNSTGGSNGTVCIGGDVSSTSSHVGYSNQDAQLKIPRMVLEQENMTNKYLKKLQMQTEANNSITNSTATAIGAVHGASGSNPTSSIHSNPTSNIHSSNLKHNTTNNINNINNTHQHDMSSEGEKIKKPNKTTNTVLPPINVNVGAKSRPSSGASQSSLQSAANR